MNKKWMALPLILTMLTLQLCGCSIGGTEIRFQLNMLTKKYVFSVNDTKCSASEVKLYLCNYKNIYGEIYGLDLWENEDESESLEDYVRDVTLDELSRVYCMALIAEQQEITLTSEEKALVTQAAETYYESLTDAEKDYIGAKHSDLEKYYTRYALACKLYDQMTDGEDEEISDDEARIIRVYQIYVTDASVLFEIESKLEDGADFQTLAATYNEASSSELTVARGYYPEEVEEVAFNLENDEVSEAIAADDGYYFIYCISKYEEELTEANKEVIRIQREQQELEENYTAFVESADFVLNDSVWEGITLPENLSEITTDSFFSTYEDLVTQ